MLPDIGVIDLMIGFPDADARHKYESLRGLAKDAGSQAMAFPAEYMFKDVPNRLDEGEDPVHVTLEAMDRCGVAVGFVGLGNEATISAIERFPERFKPTLEVDPNNIGSTVRNIRRAPRGVRYQSCHHLSRRMQPSGACERQTVLPHLPNVRRSRYPPCRKCRHRRPPGAI